jgi:hypothetical protein
MAYEMKDIARALYQAMPGAPNVRAEDGAMMWGEAQQTEHWQFCSRIAFLVERLELRIEALEKGVQHEADAAP